ncbi:hypothetical protein [Microbulbifer sp. ZKSA002]|uniref:hypothetical protein n=1 Tax=Microbulbifer sp. ZKSA002 TaxID=3243388 RepID=UPI00403A54E4
MQQDTTTWNLDTFNNKQLTYNFARSIEGFFSIYSPALKHIYGDFTIELLHGQKSRLVATPSIYGLDRYINIPENTLRPSGLYIFTGDFFDLHQYQFKAAFLAKDLTFPKNPMIGPPSAGFDLFRKFSNNNELFPVFTKNDLHEFSSMTPCLHIHLIDLRKIDLSNPERKTLKLMFEEKYTRLKSIGC